MISPQVNISEFDKSNIVRPTGAEIGAFVGSFEKGPVNVPIYITSLESFKFIFGRGINEYNNDWYQVYNYLQYASGIWVVRTAQDYGNATNEDSIRINSPHEYNDIKDTINTDGMKFIANYPGTWGNILSISVITKTEYDNNVELTNGVKAKNTFTFFEDGYYGICVFRLGKLKETYYLKSDEFDTINQKSNYIYSKITNPYVAYGENIIELTNGFNSPSLMNDFDDSYEVLNSETYDFDILIGNEAYNEGAINLAEKRKDIIAFIGVPVKILDYLVLMINGIPKLYYTNGLPVVIKENKLILSKIDEYIAKINQYIDTLPKSEFVHFTLNIKEQLDIFTEKYKFYNIASDVAGLKARNSLISPWTPNAGLTNGRIKNFKNIHLCMKQNDLNKYYKMGVNYIQGGCLMTQKTFTMKPTSFNRVNVRSLFNHLEKNIKKTLKNFVFEENSYNKRSQISSMITKFLVEVKRDRGISSGKVIVKPDKSDPNKIIINVYVQPTYVAEYINLRILNVGTNTFSEISV